MNIDELKSAWQEQDKKDFLKLDQAELMKNLKAEHQKFNRTIFWRDIREIAAVVFVIVFFAVKKTGDAINWPSWTAIALIAGVGVCLFLNTRQWKKKEKTFGNSLREELEKRCAQLAHQIRMLGRLIIWIYILPICAAIALISWQKVLNGRSSLGEFGFDLLFAGFVGLLVYAINWWAARSLQKEKAKLDLELDQLISENGVEA